MKRLMLFALLVPVACASAPSVPTAPPASFPMLQPCTLPKVERPAFCGKIAVAEDRTRSGGRTIALNVAVVPAQNEERAADPVFAVLGGGPGVAGVPEIPSFLENHGDLFRDRDLVVVDARGTGESNPLDCPIGDDKVIEAFLAGDFSVDEIRACRDRLAAGAELGAYTTAAAADDLEDVRRALGYGKATVYGGSYASRVALVYAQRYPSQTRAAILKAPMPFQNRNPLNTARDSQVALEKVFADCAADAACSAAFPTLAADFSEVMSRLEKQPASAELKGKPVPITRDVFAGVIRRMLYAADSQRAIPVTIAMANRGDFSALQRILGAAAQIDRVLNVGLFFSVTCAEDVAHYDARDVEEATRGTFSGPRLAGALLNVCQVWPAGRLPRNFDRDKRVNVPALIIAGTLDPQTPPRWAHETKKLLPNGLVVEAAGSAHTGTSTCLAKIIREFVFHPTSAVDASCAMTETRPPFLIPK